MEQDFVMPLSQVGTQVQVTTPKFVVLLLYVNGFVHYCNLSGMEYITRSIVMAACVLKDKNVWANNYSWQRQECAMSHGQFTLPWTIYLVSFTLLQSHQCIAIS